MSTLPLPQWQGAPVDGEYDAVILEFRARSKRARVDSQASAPASGATTGGRELVAAPQAVSTSNVASVRFMVLRRAGDEFGVPHEPEIE